MVKRGKLFVIEGTDGSGKATQTDLLVKQLKKEDYSVETIEFPQYGKESAKLVEQYLAGDFGPADKVDPHEVSKYYAWDRKDAAPQMWKWLNEGNIVIANRYQQSNKGHQGSKIKDPEERKRFMDWLDELEFNKYNIPRPDKVIFLHVPAEIAQKLVTKRGNEKDIHEADLQHLKDTEQSYMEIAEKEGWIIIECIKDGKLMSISEIQGLLWEKMKDLV
ncbi:dTMP kinase [candidate division KSB1 bacterium]